MWSCIWMDEKLWGTSGPMVPTVGGLERGVGAPDVPRRVLQGRGETADQLWV